MKTLSAIILLTFVSFCTFGAALTETSFRGTGGVTVTSNTTTHLVTIDGSTITNGGAVTPAFVYNIGANDTNFARQMQIGSFILSNFMAMGITQIFGASGIAIGTNNGTLWITNTGKLTTNANQFAGAPLSIVDGATVTNLQHFGAFNINTLSGIDTVGGTTLRIGNDAGWAKVLVVPPQTNASTLSVLGASFFGNTVSNAGLASFASGAFFPAGANISMESALIDTADGPNVVTMDGSNLRVDGWTSLGAATTNTGGVTINSGGAVGLTIFAPPGTATNLLEWKDTNGVVQCNVNSNGVITGNGLVAGNVLPYNPAKTKYIGYGDSHMLNLFPILMSLPNYSRAASTNLAVGGMDSYWTKTNWQAAVVPQLAGTGTNSVLVYWIGANDYPFSITPPSFTCSNIAWVWAAAASNNVDVIQLTVTGSSDHMNSLEASNIMALNTFIRTNGNSYKVLADAAARFPNPAKDRQDTAHLLTNYYGELAATLDRAMVAGAKSGPGSFNPWQQFGNSFYLYDWYSGKPLMMATNGQFAINSLSPTQTLTIGGSLYADSSYFGLTLSNQVQLYTNGILLVNSDDGAGNYERAYGRWIANIFQFGTEKGGGGTARGMQYNIAGSTYNWLFGGNSGYGLDNQQFYGVGSARNLGTPAILWSNVFTKWFVSTNGNFGIGTNLPQSALHVVGTIQGGFGCMTMSTGTVTTAAAAQNKITNFNYAVSTGTIGISTNTWFIATNAGYYRISFGAGIASGNADTCELQCFTNGPAIAPAQMGAISLNVIMPTPAVADTGFKEASVFLPAGCHVFLQTSNSSATAQTLKNICFNVGGAN